jgi:hypothetical protein
MSEEIVDFQIVAERILAAVLAKFGPVEVSIKDLISDYSGKQVAINQNENDDENVIVELVDVDAT